MPRVNPLDVAHAIEIIVFVVLVFKLRSLRSRVPILRSSDPGRVVAGWAAIAVVGIVIWNAPNVIPLPGVSARCQDSWYSYSQHATGTCSGHGGVARWINRPG
jgi:hypothetical protein